MTTPRQYTYEEWLAAHQIEEVEKDCECCDGDGYLDHDCDCEFCDLSEETCEECDGTGSESLSKAEYQRQIKADTERWAAFTSTTQEAR